MAVRPPSTQPTPRRRGTDLQTYDELQGNHHIIVGSPDTVIRKLRYVKDRLGIGSLLLEAQSGPLSHKDTMRSLELFGKEVLPALKD